MLRLTPGASVDFSGIRLRCAEQIAANGAKHGLSGSQQAHMEKIDVAEMAAYLKDCVRSGDTILDPENEILCTPEELASMTPEERARCVPER
jgi:hypothetical protein